MDWLPGPPLCSQPAWPQVSLSPQGRMGSQASDMRSGLPAMWHCRCALMTEHMSCAADRLSPIRSHATTEHKFHAGSTGRPCFGGRQWQRRSGRRWGGRRRGPLRRHHQRQLAVFAVGAGGRVQEPPAAAAGPSPSPLSPTPYPSFALVCIMTMCPLQTHHRVSGILTTGSLALQLRSPFLPRGRSVVRACSLWGPEQCPIAQSVL